MRAGAEQKDKFGRVERRGGRVPGGTCGLIWLLHQALCFLLAGCWVTLGVATSHPQGPPTSLLQPLSSPRLYREVRCIREDLPER